MMISQVFIKMSREIFVANMQDLLVLGHLQTISFSSMLSSSMSSTKFYDNNEYTKRHMQQSTNKPTTPAYTSELNACLYLCVK